MEKQTDRALSLWMEDAFRDKMFLRKLGINRADLSQLFDQVNWRSQLSSLVPIRRRISCAEALPYTGTHRRGPPRRHDRLPSLPGRGRTH